MKTALPQVGKRKFNHWVLLSLAVVVSLSLVFWWSHFRSVINPQFRVLTGRWQRPDGGYVMEIKGIAANGAMDAGYFNPRSIHVAKAEASRDGGALKVFVELRDVNYPGSSYALTYDPAADRLTGTYHQAVQKQRFPVVFARVQ